MLLNGDSSPAAQNDKKMRTYNIIIAISLFFLIFPLFAFAQLPDPLKFSDFPSLINAAAKFVFTLIIPVAVIAIVWSGVLFITAGGNEERVKKARSAFTWAIIGLAIGLIGTGLVSLIQDILGGQ